MDPSTVELEGGIASNSIVQIPPRPHSPLGTLIFLMALFGETSFLSVFNFMPYLYFLMTFICG